MKCLLKFLVSSESTKLGSRARVARQADFKGSSENVEHSDQSARRLEENETIAIERDNSFSPIFKYSKIWLNDFYLRSMHIGGSTKPTLT